MLNNLLYCPKCQKMVYQINHSLESTICHDEPMLVLIPNSTKASVEKHVPIISLSENECEVMVGSVEHPMIAEHYIMWVLLKTNKGVSIKHLECNHLPRVIFSLAADEIVEDVLAYCNLHGLWSIL